MSDGIFLKNSQGCLHGRAGWYKKESTAVLTPEKFNRLINVDAITQWLSQKSESAEYDQANVDALRNLISTKELSVKPKSDGVFKLPSDYYRLLSVAFKTKSKGTESPWMPVKRIRSDSYTLSVSGVNPYRTPTLERLYYAQEGDKIKAYPSNSKVAAAKIIYYARPLPIVYSPDGKNNKHGNLEFQQKKEVIDIAVRIFLERVKEERYQTQLIEEGVRKL